MFTATLRRIIDSCAVLSGLMVAFGMVSAFNAWGSSSSVTVTDQGNGGVQLLVTGSFDSCQKDYGTDNTGAVMLYMDDWSYVWGPVYGQGSVTFTRTLDRASLDGTHIFRTRYGGCSGSGDGGTATVTYDNTPTITSIEPSGETYSAPFDIKVTAIFKPTLNPIKGRIYGYAGGYLPGKYCYTENCTYSYQELTGSLFDPSHGGPYPFNITANPTGGTPVNRQSTYSMDKTPSISVTEPVGTVSSPVNFKATASFKPTLNSRKGYIRAYIDRWIIPYGYLGQKDCYTETCTYDYQELKGSLLTLPTGTTTVSFYANGSKGGSADASQAFSVSNCDLKAKLTGPGVPGIPGMPGSTLPFGTGSTYPIKGEYTTSSTQPVNWTLTLPNGKTTNGTGSEIKDIWDGTLNGDTLAPAGTYQATLTVTNSSDGNCTNTATLPIIVKPASDNQCGLRVSFGSSAHVANGNLSHSQELFSARSGALPVGLNLYYNSRDSHNASLGRGWSHDYDITLKENTDGSVLISEGNMKYEYFTLSNGAYLPMPGYYSTLAKNSAGTFTLATKDGQVFTFNADGTLASIADRKGNITTFAYTSGNLTAVTDPSGRKATLAYDADNHLTSVTDSTGNKYTFAYSGNTLTSVTYPDGGQWQYIYDANAFMLTKTDPLGNTTTYVYDNQHRVVSSIDPEGQTRSMTYPQPGTDTTKTTTFAEKDGGVWTYRYDTQAGTLMSKTDPQGGVTSYTYDAAGNRLSTALPDGTTTTSTYDAAGNMTSTTDALGQTTSYTYNAFGQVLTIKDPQGGVTSYTYDAAGNMTAMTDPAGATTQYQYDARGNVTKVTNPLGQATTFVYDAAGNLASTTDPAGATTSFAYDAAGNMTSQTDANGAVTRFEYDARNRLVKAIDPAGNVTTYTYDVNGNRTSQTDANGNVTRYEYNARGQVVKVVDALGNATIYTYGGSGCASCGGGTDKLTSLTDANGNSTSYHYDTLGRLLSETDALGNTTSYAYDSKGNLSARTDANGATIKYTYDGLGRLLKKTYPDTTEESYTYDAKGSILTATNRNVSYTFTYDAAGKIKSVADSTGKVISYEYDALGNKTKMISPEGKSISYTYDTANRLTAILNGGTFTFGYDSIGRRTKLSYSNGDTATYSYDKQGRLTNLVHKNAAGAVIASNGYALDKIGNRLGNTTQDRTISYQYDAIYRLTQALSNTPGFSTNTKTGKGTTTATQQQKEFYTYDPVGNRLASDKTKSYTYNQANQLITNGGTYTYDKNGNLLQKVTPDGVTTYSWDYENRLVKVVTSTTTAEYAYDPFGRRIEKQVTESGATTTTRYFYDNQAILFEYDEKGNIVNRYIHGSGIDEPLMLTIGKDKYCYHADGLGSIIALTDTAGKVVQTYEYDSFGNLKDQKNRVKQPFTYTGREWDKETGLYYYRARYYDPMDGRFISKDPIGFRGGINLYSYVQNNPVGYIDPFGLDKYTESFSMSGSIMLFTAFTAKFDITMDTTACTATNSGPTYTGVTMGPVASASASANIVEEKTIGRAECCKADGTKGHRITKRIRVRGNTYASVNFKIGATTLLDTKYSDYTLTCDCI
jgi:RHS repeat-associated protein